MTLTANALRKTWQSDAWFARAHEQDLQRRTELGTLGYLPLEIREVIWLGILDTTEEPYCLPMCYPSVTLKTLRKAVGPAAIEIGHTWLRGCVLHCDSVFLLGAFFDAIKHVPRPIVRLEISLDGSCRSHERKWIDVLSSLPLSIQSVSFELANELTCRMSKKKADKALTNFIKLNNAVLRSNAHVITSISMIRGSYPQLPEAQKIAFMAVLRDGDRRSTMNSSILPVSTWPYEILDALEAMQGLWLRKCRASERT